MLARIEIKGNLAPIQEYGRHQTAAAKKRKDNKNKNKEAGEGEAGQAEQPEKDHANYDDKYYDLDDGFIDDGEIVEDDGFADLNEGASNFYSQYHGSVNDSSSMQRLSAMAAGRKFGPNGELLSICGEEAREEAEQKLFLKREKKEQERIQKRFKILTIDDIEIAGLLGGEKVNREMDSWGQEN
jgi:hypothetical protein